MTEINSQKVFICDTNEIKVNHKNEIDGLKLLSLINNNTIKACFFDPQYRGVLDKLSYGNEGEKRGRARTELRQMSSVTIAEFIEEIDRILVPSGHLFLWVDKFHLCEGVDEWLNETDLQIVDLITWDKQKFGMGYRSRRQCEYCIVIQKKPLRAKGVWRIHNIPDVWCEKVKKNHPHSKPIELQKVLIEAVTDIGDIVVDPAAGGFSIFKACEQCDRVFIGGDLKIHSF